MWPLPETATGSGEGTHEQRPLLLPLDDAERVVLDGNSRHNTGLEVISHLLRVDVEAGRLIGHKPPVLKKLSQV